MSRGRDSPDALDSLSVRLRALAARRSLIHTPIRGYIHIMLSWPRLSRSVASVGRAEGVAARTFLAAALPLLLQHLARLRIVRARPYVDIGPNGDGWREALLFRGEEQL